MVFFAGKSWPLGIQVVASGNSSGISGDSGDSGDSGEMGEASAPQTPLPHAPEARMTVVYTDKLPQTSRPPKAVDREFGYISRGGSAPRTPP